MSIVLLIIVVSNSNGEIRGSKHDFSTQGWSEGQLCIVCHTPHNADQSVSEAPLWNHENSTEDSYDLYVSGTMNEQTVQPLGISKLCLSCHDGTVAVDSFGDNPGGIETILPGEDAYIGTDLSDDHPISITWTHQTIVPFTVDSRCTYCHDNIHTQEDPSKYRMPFYSYDGGVTYKVECSSCHDPHNKGDGSQGPDYMLRTTIEGSFLCIQCHKR